MFPSADTPHHARLADTRTTHVSGAAGGLGHRGFHLSSEPRSKGDQFHQGAGILSEEEKTIAKIGDLYILISTIPKMKQKKKKKGWGEGAFHCIRSAQSPFHNTITPNYLMPPHPHFFSLNKTRKTLKLSRVKLDGV